jgi:hypothetical protein
MWVLGLAKLRLNKSAIFVRHVDPLWYTSDAAWSKKQSTVVLRKLART